MGTTLEVSVTKAGEVVFSRRVYDGIDRPDYTSIERMSIARAEQFRGEVDAAIAEARQRLAANARDQLPKLREQLREQLDLYERTKRMIGELEGVTGASPAPSQPLTPAPLPTGEGGAVAAAEGGR